MPTHLLCVGELETAVWAGLGTRAGLCDTAELALGLIVPIPRTCSGISLAGTSELRSWILLRTTASTEAGWASEQHRASLSWLLETDGRPDCARSSLALAQNSANHRSHV